MDFMALATLTAQLLPITNDSFGGVSGQDSVWRAVLAQMDQSMGGLYLVGLFSIAIPRTSISAHRTGLLHTPYPTSVDSIEVVVRQKWMHLASQERRRGQLFMLPNNDNALDFSPNLSMFIIPYMLNCDPPPTQFIRLTRVDLHKTAARSVARYGIFLATIGVLSAVRMTILWFYMENGVERYLMLGSEIGRCAMAVLQESSILTYSCGYKCVSTWASPVIYAEWDISEEGKFRNEVVQSIGHAYHAYALFLLVELIWKWMGFLFPWWQRQFGPRIFSQFNSPGDDEFREEEQVILRLRVEKQLDFSATWKEKYTVDFKVPKAFGSRALTEILVGEPWLRWGAICFLGGFAVCGVLGPIKFFGDGRPANGAKIMFTIMQLVAWVPFYKDIPNQSINCGFVSSSTEHSKASRIGSSGVIPIRIATTPIRRRPIQHSSTVALGQPNTSSIHRDSRETVPSDDRSSAPQPVMIPQSNDEHAVNTEINSDPQETFGVHAEGEGLRDGDMCVMARTTTESSHASISDPLKIATGQSQTV